MRLAVLPKKCMTMFVDKFTTLFNVRIASRKSKPIPEHLAGEGEDHDGAGGQTANACDIRRHRSAFRRGRKCGTPSSEFVQLGRKMSSIWRAGVCVSRSTSQMHVGSEHMVLSVSRCMEIGVVAE